MISISDNNDNNELKKSMDELKQMMFDQHKYFEREIEMLKVDHEKNIKKLEKKLTWEKDTALCNTRDLGNDIKKGLINTMEMFSEKLDNLPKLIEKQTESSEILVEKHKLDKRTLRE